MLSKFLRFASVFTLAATSAVCAQDYPSKSITLVVPFAAGGPTDTLARNLGVTLTSSLKQQIVVDNIDELQNACAELVKLANQNGGEDNITVVIAKFTGEDLPEPDEEGVKLEIIDLGGIHDTADQAEPDEEEDTAEIPES